MLCRHVGPEHRAEAGGLGGDLGLRAPVGYGEGVPGRRVALCLLRRQNVPHPGRRCPVSGAGTERLEAWDEQQKILKKSQEPELFARRRTAFGRFCAHSKNIREVFVETDRRR